MKHVVLFTVYPTPLGQSFCAFSLFHSLLYLYSVWYISRVSKNISWMKVKRVGLKSLPPKCVWPFPSASWRCPGTSDAFLPVIWHSVCAALIFFSFPPLPTAGCLCGAVWSQHAASVWFLLAVSEGTAQSGSGGSLHHPGCLSGP